MALRRATFNGLAVGEMAVEEMPVEEMPGEEMPGEKMTLGEMKRPRIVPSSFYGSSTGISTCAD